MGLKRSVCVAVVGILVAGLLLAFGAAPRSVLAAEVVVDGSPDTCSWDDLNSAISGATSGDNITFDCSDNVIDFHTGGVITIDKTITINGSNAGGQAMVFDGNNETNFFNVIDETGDLTLEDLTLQHGYSDFEGGAIDLDGSGALRATNVTFLANTSADYGGAIDNDQAQMVIHQCVFTSNTVSGNSDYGYGGAIFNYGELTIDESEFRDNTSGGTTAAGGGAIFDGRNDGLELIINRSTFENNSSGGDAGAGYGGAVYSWGKMTINQSSFKDNSVGGSTAISYGGAVYVDKTSTSTISQSTFSSNQAGGGAGIAVAGTVYNAGTLTINQSTFHDNQAGGGSGLSYGGVISNAGTLAVSESEFRDNQAGGGDGDSFGGVINTEGTLTITRSTFRDNQAGGGAGVGSGGAIYFANGSHKVLATTFAGNHATSGSSASIDNDVESVLIAWSTIVQPATAGSASLFIDGPLELVGVLLGGPDMNCAIEDEGSVNDSYSLANDTSCGLDAPSSADDLADLGIGPLATATISGVEQSYYPLLQGSPAINAGPTNCDTVIQPGSDVDQLGTPRPLGPACDIGAIEVVYPATLCADRWNGELRMVDEGGDCGRSERLITLPADAPLTLCVNSWNGSASLGDSCGRSEHPIVVWGDGSVEVCVNSWNGSLRVSDSCSWSEREERL